MLSQEYLKEVLDYDPNTGVFVWKKRLAPRGRVGSIAGFVEKKAKNRILIRINNKLYLAHRLAWLYVYGKFPKDEIDHINHTPNDNRIDNLRDATRLQNLHNLPIRRSNKTGISGVCWSEDRNKWVSAIQVNKKMIALGRFVDFFEACCARKSAERKYGFHVNHGATYA